LNKQGNEALFKNNHILPRQYVRFVFIDLQKAHYSIPCELKQKRCTSKKLRPHCTHPDGQKDNVNLPTKCKPVSLSLPHLYKSYNHDTRRACTPTPAPASVLSIGTRRGPLAVDPHRSGREMPPKMIKQPAVPAREKMAFPAV